MKKKCSVCQHKKSAEHFTKDKRSRSGLSSECLECRRKSKKRWAAANPEKVKAYGRQYRIEHPEVVRNLKKLYRKRHPDRAKAQVRAAVKKKWNTYYAPTRWRAWLRRKYGITEQQFTEALQKQGNCCAICKGNQNCQRSGQRRERLYVDHCHKTKRFRGLLCFKCNTLLGMAGDSVATLQRAVEYVKANELDF